MTESKTRKEELDKILNNFADKDIYGLLTSYEKRKLRAAQKERELIVYEESLAQWNKKQEQKKSYKKINKRFKEDEKWVAEQYGEKLLGHKLRGKPCPDTQGLFTTEVTSTKQKLSFIKSKLAEAEAHNTSSRIPRAIIFFKGELRKRGIVCYFVEDDIQLHGK